MTPKAADTTKKTPPREEQGVIWVASTGVIWQESDVDVEKLKKYSANIYGDGLAQKQRNLIFTGPPAIRVIDPDGEEDKVVSRWISDMATSPTVQLYYRMQQAWHSTFWYGPGLFNPVMEWVGNEYRLTALRYLPPDSFATAPTSSKKYRSYNPILPGIALSQDNEVEYWQVQDETDTTPRRVDNVFVIQDPIRPELGSRPTVLSVLANIAMLDYLWAAQMQKAHRTGSPLLFVRISGARTAAQLGGKTGDVEYAQKFLKNWGKNTGYVLRDNMELVNPHITDTADNLETIDRLDQMITAHFSPSGFISKSGPTIGGSSAPEKELLAAYVRGIQSWLEAGFSHLLQEVVDANGYDGFTVRVDLPDLEFDERDIEIRQATIGDKTQSLTINEIRALLHHPPLTPEEVAELRDEYAARAPAAPVAMTNARKKPATYAKVRNQTEEDLEVVMSKARDRVIAALKKAGAA